MVKATELWPQLSDIIKRENKVKVEYYNYKHWTRPIMYWNKRIKREGVEKVESLNKVRITTLADDYAGGGRCLAQHGVSYFIEIEEKEETFYYLFDTGLYHEPILFNANRLAIPIDRIQKVILSHSHYDHTGGLIGLLEALESKEREVFAHPEVFKKSY